MSRQLPLRIAVLVLCLTASAAPSQDKAPPEKENPLSLKRAELRVEHPRATRAVFSPDGRWLVTSGPDAMEPQRSVTIKVWDTATGKPVGEPIHLAGAKFVLSLESPWVSADGKYLVVHYRVGLQSTLNRVQVWELPAVKAVGETLKFKGSLACMAVGSTGRVLTVSTEGGFGKTWTSTLQLWDLATGKPSGDARVVKALVHGVALTKGDKQVFLSTGGFGTKESKTVRSYDLEKGTYLGEPWPTGSTLRVVLDPAEKFVLTQSVEEGKKAGFERWNMLRRWNVALGKAVGEPLRIREIGSTLTPARERERAVVHTDARTVAVLKDDETVQVFDLEAGKAVGLPLKHAQPVYHMLFSANGKQLLTVSGAFARPDGCWLWDVATGKRLARLPEEGKIMAIAFHPDRKRVATTNDKGILSTWELTVQK